MSIYDLPGSKQDYINQFYTTLLSLLNSGGGGTGDIATPRLTLIGSVKVKIDELMAQSEGVQDNITNADNSNTLDLYINSILDEAGKHVLQTAPLHIIIPSDGGLLSLVANSSPNDDTGYMYLPDDYLRFVSFKVEGWQQEVSEPVLTRSKIYSNQRYPVLRGGKAKPIVALNSKVKVNTPIAQVDTVTLQGTSGSANISGPGSLTKLAAFSNSLTETATNFVTDHAADYLLKGIVLTSSSEDVIFTAQVAGTAFDHPIILTVDVDLTGDVNNTTPNVPAREGKRIIEYFSDPDKAHVLEKFLYIANLSAQDIQSNLHDAITWMAASKLLQIYGEFSGNQSYAQKALEQVELSYKNLM